MAVNSSNSSAVEQVLGTFKSLATRFNSTGAQFVENLDVHALEGQAVVFSNILDSLQEACSEAVPAQIEYHPAEWNTWLAASACARPSSLPGRKSGRRAPRSVPGSNSVWWIDKNECASARNAYICFLLDIYFHGTHVSKYILLLMARTQHSLCSSGTTVHQEKYISPPEAASASIAGRRSVKLNQSALRSPDSAGSAHPNSLISVCAHSVAHLHQTSSNIHVHEFSATNASPTSSTVRLLSLTCSVDILAFNSTDSPEEEEQPVQQHSKDAHHVAQELAGNDMPTAGISMQPELDSSGKKPLEDASNVPQTTEKRQLCTQSSPDAKKMRFDPATSIPQAVAAQQPVWREELSICPDRSSARLSRVSALATCSVCIGSERDNKYTAICAAGTLAIPTSLGCTQQPSGDESDCPSQLYPSAMVWIVPVQAGASGGAVNDGAGMHVPVSGALIEDARQAAPATCLLVDNEKAAVLQGELISETTRTQQDAAMQTVAMQPVGDGAVMCCTSDAEGSVRVWLLQFEMTDSEGQPALRCTRCEMQAKLQPLSKDTPALTINSSCGDHHTARVVRWIDENARACTQLHIEENDRSNACKGCMRFGGCCSCGGCGGLGKTTVTLQQPGLVTKQEKENYAVLDVVGSFQIRHKIVHEVLFKEFGKTTAVAVSGKFVFAGSDTGALAVWECGVGGAVERVAGWWLEGESVSVIVPARSGEQMFILVGMHGGHMYSFDTCRQLL